jgi:rSAM/selenodomain-associated transferase 2
MLTIVIPALNAERVLGATLGALVPGAVSGLVKDVIVVDGGSSDETTFIAEGAGCRVLSSRKGRGCQLAAGADAARGEWLMFLHADTVLAAGWEAELRQFIDDAELSGDVERAACFTFRLNARGAKARWLERGVALRCMVLALPYGDQGLVVSKRLYNRVGGFAEVALMEDVDIVRRIGRRRLVTLRSAAVTSAERYMRDGFLRRAARNLVCLALYYLRVPRGVLARFYGA